MSQDPKGLGKKIKRLFLEEGEEAPAQGSAAPRRSSWRAPSRIARSAGRRWSWRARTRARPSEGWSNSCPQGGKRAHETDAVREVLHLRRHRRRDRVRGVEALWRAAARG